MKMKQKIKDKMSAWRPEITACMKHICSKCVFKPLLLFLFFTMAVLWGGFTAPSSCGALKSSDQFNHPFGKGCRVFSGFNRLAIYFSSIDDEHPFIEILRMERQERGKASKNPDSGRRWNKNAPDLEALPFIFRIDTNLDGKADVEMRPGVRTGEMLTHALANVGCQFNSIWYPDDSNLMPLFDRAEFQLHDTFKAGSVINRTKFRINRVVLRRRDDGNLLVTLRDQFFSTGRDIVIKSEFKW